MVRVMGYAAFNSPGAPPRRQAVPAAGAGDRPVQCGGCSASFEPEAWGALALVAVLTGDAIATHVVKWPQGVRIEIRRCPRCGRSMARTSDPSSG